MKDILHFPHPLTANEDGLLALGGDLSTDRLILAYRFGIFPWYSKNRPILWWAPGKRFVIDIGHLHIPKSMKKYLNKPIFSITVDQHFDYIIHQCQHIHGQKRSGTWITAEMNSAYCALHKVGLAHSVEVWYEDAIVGGIYGVAIGQIFSGESMFTKISNASKFGIIILHQILSKLNFQILDCQQYTRHIEMLGGYNVDQTTYFQAIRKNLLKPNSPKPWSQDLIPLKYRRIYSDSIKK